MFRRGRLLEVLAKSLRQQADHHYRQQSRGAEFGDGRHAQGQPKNEHSADSWLFHVPIQGVDRGEDGRSCCHVGGHHGAMRQQVRFKDA